MTTRTKIHAREKRHARWLKRTCAQRMWGAIRRRRVADKKASPIEAVAAFDERFDTPVPDTSRSETASPPPGGTGGVGDESIRMNSKLVRNDGGKLEWVDTSEPTKTPPVSGPETIGS